MTPPSLLRLLLTLALVAFTIHTAGTLLRTAYDIRTHALNTYGMIIHEVCPLNEAGLLLLQLNLLLFVHL
jgi:hypothetical protein